MADKLPPAWTNGYIPSQAEWQEAFADAIAEGAQTAEAAVSSQVTSLSQAAAANAAAIANLAPLANPAFSGSPTAPTPSMSAAGNEIATAQLVRGIAGATLAISIVGTRNLSAAEAGGNANFIVSGSTSGPALLLFPDGLSGRWTIQNSTNNVLSARMAAGGSAVAIHPGYAKIVFGNGSGIYPSHTDYDSIAITGTASVPTATAGDASSQPASTYFVTTAVNAEAATRYANDAAAVASANSNFVAVGHSTAQFTSQSYRPSDNVGVTNLLTFTAGPQDGVIKIDGDVVAATSLPAQCLHQIYLNSNLLWSGGSSGSQSGTATAHVAAGSYNVIQQVLTPGSSGGGTYSFVLQGISFVFVSGGS